MSTVWLLIISGTGHQEHGVYSPFPKFDTSWERTVVPGKHSSILELERRPDPGLTQLVLQLRVTANRLSHIVFLGVELKRQRVVHYHGRKTCAKLNKSILKKYFSTRSTTAAELEVVAAREGGPAFDQVVDGVFESAC